MPNKQLFQQILNAIQSGQNPEQLAMSMLQSRADKNPMFRNLMGLAEANNFTEIEKFARNLSKEKGIDYDIELNAFKQSLGLR